MIKLKLIEDATGSHLSEIEIAEVPHRQSVVTVEGVHYRVLGVNYILANRIMEYGILVERIHKENEV